MIRAVVDTNVWVSALLNPAGAPARIADAFARGDFVAVVPNLVLDEVRAVLARPRLRRRHGLDDAEIEDYARLIGERAEVVATAGESFGCRDPSDDALLEAAVKTGVDLVVTRDDDLKRDPALAERMRARGVTIASVSAFLALLA